MKKSSNVNPGKAEQRDNAPLAASAAAVGSQEADAANAERAEKLKAAQDKAAQLMREQRYDEARHILKDAENLQAEESPTQPVPQADLATRLAEAQGMVAQFMQEKRFDEARQAIKEVEALQTEETNLQRLADAMAEREKAAQLTNEGKYAEAQQALERADELEKLVEGWKGRPKRLFAAVRSRLPERLKTERKDEPEKPVLAAEEPVVESMGIVKLHSKIAAAVGLLPGGLLNFVALLAVQVPMVWRIARAFGHNVTKEQVRGVLISLFTSLIPGLVGHGTGLAIASLPAVLAGTVVYFVATPILAYGLTHAVGNVFIMHFESGGTLLTFDPKAFTEHFINEFKKAGGTLRKADEPTPAPSETPA
jgi:uncharacterized protein (DUF697 family)